LASLEAGWHRQRKRAVIQRWLDAKGERDALSVDRDRRPGKWTPGADVLKRGFIGGGRKLLGLSEQRRDVVETVDHWNLLGCPTMMPPRNPSSTTKQR
jgi:hypothetical protein